METLLQDVRHAARSLRRSRGHAALVILTLAAGIAAATVVFGVMNPYLLRPLPYAEPDRLIQVEQVERPWPTQAMSPEDEPGRQMQRSSPSKR